MKQIYNLLETIKDDKERVEACEKHLRYLKGQLSVHEDALKRITSIPEEKPLKNITPPKESPSKDARVRITQDNWKSLGIEVGDTVEIVVSGDRDFDDDSVFTVTGIDENSSQTFLILNGDWYGYNWNSKGKDELYLIKQSS